MNLINGEMRTKAIRLGAQRRRELSEFAESIADEYFARVRVEPLSLAERKAIPVAFGRYGAAFDGALEFCDDRFRMFVNLDRVDNKSSTRSRFTLAHELGHFFIDEHRNELQSGRTPGHRSRCEYENDEVVEQEADHFASCLLMPEQRFRNAIRKAKPGWETIRQLSTSFGTSWTSTAIRYVALCDHPCAIIKWNPGEYAWKWLSESFFSASIRKTIESTERITVGSATARALAGESPGESGYFQNGTVASAWFPYVTAGSLRDVILIEAAVPLGKFGVLTVLHSAPS